MATNDSSVLPLNTLNNTYAIATVGGEESVCVRVNSGLYAHGEKGSPKCVVRNYMKHLTKWRYIRTAMYHKVKADAPLRVGEKAYILNEDGKDGEFYFVIDIAHKDAESITYILGK